LVAVDADLDIGALETMGSWVMRMEHKMDGDEEHVVQRILMERAGLVKAVLQSVDMCGKEGIARQSSLVEAPLMDLKALLGHVDIFDRGNRLSSLLRLGWWIYCLPLLCFHVPVASQLVQPGTHFPGFFLATSLSAHLSV
jgi:hypothetical protein